jgi:alpha-D-ribose 1-methylphosphonate 5-triphosphate synthase subunit PhnG
MTLPFPPATEDRQRWMAVLARAGADAMRGLLEGQEALPEAVVLRGPEVGLVMVRGRIGGGGGAFNLGEMTVTRCTVRAGGFVGHASIAGRETGRALLAARLDAALQDPARRAALLEAVIAPLAAEQAAARVAVAAKAAATRVEFFTLQTMRT